MSFLDVDDNLTGNFIADHWYGRYSLPRSYWINGSLIVWLASGLLYWLITLIEGSDLSLQVVAAIALLAMAASITVWLWGVVGIWRSAHHHSDRGGGAFWAGLARVVVVLGAMSFCIRLGMSLPGTIETARLAVNDDPLGLPAEVAVVGNALLIDGLISQGTADKVALALNNHPGVTEVSLTSGGGRIRDALQIAAIVRERSLDTKVSANCESACTFILLAGKMRSAGFGSRVGFHQPTFPGLLPAEQAEIVAAARADYAKSGLRDAFVSRVLATSPDQMWYPTEPELFDAGVLNGFDRERVVADNAASAEQLGKKLPLALDELTRLVSVEANGVELTYNYAVSVGIERFDLPAARSELQRNNRQEVCAQPLLPQLFSAGAIYHYSYLDPDGRTLADFRIDSCEA
jgi:hypothetical protein